MTCELRSTPFSSRLRERCQVLWQLSDVARELAAATAPGGQQAALVAAHEEYRRDALRESSALAQELYGVALGQHVLSPGEPGVPPHVWVDFLRPQGGDEHHGLIVSGLAENGQRLTWLLDTPAPAPAERTAAVIRLDAWR